MAVSTGFSSMTLVEILNKTSELAIMKYYFHIDEIPTLINAPYRPDKKPSVGIYENNGSLYFKDFSTGEFGSIYTLLEKTFNMSFYEVLNMLATNISALTSKAFIRKTKHVSNSSHKVSKSIIRCKFRDWRPYDLEYWESYGISLEWLKFGDVYPISHIFITKEDTTFVISADKYAYAFIERKEGNPSYKIYQPFSTDRKWYSKHDSSVWDLWTKLPEKNDNLIITSSRKDALCIWENTGIPAVSLQGEGYIPKEHVVYELKMRFENIFILYDNDFKSNENHGRILGKELAERFNLTQIEIPDKYKSKDTSDLCKNYDRETVYRVISSLVEDKIKELNSYKKPF